MDKLNVFFNDFKEVKIQEATRKVSESVETLRYLTPIQEDILKVMIDKYGKDLFRLTVNELKIFIKIHGKGIL